MSKNIKTNKSVFYLKLFVFIFGIFFSLLTIAQAQPTPPSPGTIIPEEDPGEPAELLKPKSCCEITNKGDADKEVIGCYAVATNEECQKKATKEVSEASFKDSLECFDSFFSKIENRDSLGSYCLNQKDELAKQLPTNSEGIFSKACLSSGNLGACLRNSFFPDSGLPGPKSTNATVTKNLILTYIGLVINLVLGFLGIIFLVIIIYAGIQWLLAADDENKIKEQKDRLRNAVVGIAITIMAYGLSYLVLSIITKAT